MKRILLISGAAILAMLVITAGLRQILKTDAGDIKQSKMAWPSSHTGLKVGNTELCWVFQSRLTPRTGNLFFCRPQSLDPIWEFAPCSRRRLCAVVTSDLQTSYIRSGDSRAESLFPSHNAVSRGGAAHFPLIPVAEGQILLARLVQAPGTVYAIKFAEQKGDLDQGSIRIEYREFNATSAEPEHGADPIQPLRSI